MIGPSTFTIPLVENILRHCNDHEWTIQGFGMIRTYLGPVNNPKKIRLNVWDRRVAIKHVSTIHDHPWDFSSLIVAGKTTNVRFIMLDDELILTHSYMIIQTGIEGDKKDNEIKHCHLMPCIPEQFERGNVYFQEAHEIHETRPIDGTVTINERIGDTQHARVFWSYGSEWVDAKPKVCTATLAKDICNYSLKTWFKEC